MDQKTANHVALVKVYTIAIVAVGFGVAIVILAATHDGQYAQLIVDNFPFIIFACLGTLGVPWLAEIISNTLQAKYTGLQVVPSVPTPPPAPTPPAAAAPTQPTEPVAGS